MTALLAGAFITLTVGLTVGYATHQFAMVRSEKEWRKEQAAKSVSEFIRAVSRLRYLSQAINNLDSKELIEPKADAAAAEEVLAVFFENPILENARKISKAADEMAEDSISNPKRLEHDINVYQVNMEFFVTFTHTVLGLRKPAPIPWRERPRYYVERLQLRLKR